MLWQQYTLRVRCNVYYTDMIRFPDYNLLSSYAHMKGRLSIKFILGQILNFHCLLR
jgi:hypothetical protein